MLGISFFIPRTVQRWIGQFPRWCHALIGHPKPLFPVHHSAIDGTMEHDMKYPIQISVLTCLQV
jgi:hypothetical protein